jgi:hypothetical protein
MVQNLSDEIMLEIKDLAFGRLGSAAARPARHSDAGATLTCGDAYGL